MNDDHLDINRSPLSLALSPLLRRGERGKRRGALARLLPLLHGFCGGEGRGEEVRYGPGCG
jgi:hypothetical protein